jgi:transformer-2 protein
VFPATSDVIDRPPPRRDDYNDRPPPPRRYDDGPRDYAPRDYGSRPYGRDSYNDRPPRRDHQEKAPPSEVIGVFGLSVQTRESDLDYEFSRFGTVESVNIVYDQRVRGATFFLI